jgi:hypothetical protein
MSIEAFVSIPAAIAYLNLAVFDAHREGAGRFIRWRGQCCAGADAKACAVPRANDLIALDNATGELSTIMGANVFDGEVLTVKVEYGNLRFIRIDNPPLAWRELFAPRYRDPFTHFNPLFKKFKFGACEIVSRRYGTSRFPWFAQLLLCKFKNIGHHADSGSSLWERQFARRSCPNA